VGPGFGINELHVHPDLFAAPSDAAFDNITDTEVAPELLRVDKFALVHKGSVSGDHEASGNTREIGRQIVGDPIGEIFLVWVVRKVGKRQDDERETRRRSGDTSERASQAQRRLNWRRDTRGRCHRIGAHPVGTYWARDVFDALLPHVFEPIGELVANLVAHHPRDADAPGLGQCLQPGSDIDPVAEDVVAVDDHVAEIDADPECDALVLGYVGLTVDHCPLHLDSATDRIDDAREVDQHPVAGGLDDPPVVFCDLGVDQLRRWALNRSCVPSSSAPIRREYPATSAARIAVRRRTEGISRPGRLA